MPPHVWEALAIQFSDRLSLSENSAVSQCVLRCCIICVVTCGDPSLAKVLSHQLGLVTRAMVAWMLPHDMKTKKQTSLEFDHLLHMCGCIRLFLHTRWQATAGCKRTRCAKQRLQCVHPDVTAAMFQPGQLTTANVRSCVVFLSTQLECKQGVPLDHGCLYLLCSLAVTLEAHLVIVVPGVAPCRRPCHGFMSTCMTFS